MELRDEGSKFDTIAQRCNALDVECAARGVTALTEDHGFSQIAHIRGPNQRQSDDAAAIVAGGGSMHASYR